MIGPARVKPVGNLFEQEDGQTHSVGSNNSLGLRTVWFPAHSKTSPAKVIIPLKCGISFYFRHAEANELICWIFFNSPKNFPLDNWWCANRRCRSLRSWTKAAVRGTSQPGEMLSAWSCSCWANVNTADNTAVTSGPTGVFSTGDALHHSNKCDSLCIYLQNVPLARAD